MIRIYIVSYILNLLYKTIIFKDYKAKEDTVHKGMHNLSGVFLQDGDKCNLEGMDLYCFSVVYPNKSRLYYVESESDYKQWISNIRKATGYASLTDIYEVRQKLGNGKFGLVRLGIHKQSGRKVAIKVMNKKEMNNQDLELVKTEIEILKVCQQPNIIRLYDVFENIDYIYISKFYYLCNYYYYLYYL